MRILIAAPLFLGLSVSASAADLPVPDLPPTDVQQLPVDDWGGFYFGVFGGGVRPDVDPSLSDVGGAVLSRDVEDGTFPSDLELDSVGAFGGARVGYLFDAGRFVTGLEASIAGLDGDADEVFTETDEFLYPGALVNTSFSSEVSWLATLKGRAGLKIPSALLYVTGGLAVGEVSNEYDIAIPSIGYQSPTADRSETDFGWVAGAGVEYSLTRLISLQLEYQHFDLGEQEVRGTDPPVFGDEFLEYEFDNKGDSLSLGLNVRF